MSLGEKKKYSGKNEGRKKEVGDYYLKFMGSAFFDYKIEIGS